MPMHTDEAPRPASAPVEHGELPDAHACASTVPRRYCVDAAADKQGCTVRRFQVLKLVGTGSFGKVALVKNLDTDNLYAMKAVSKVRHAAKKHKQRVLAEKAVLSTCDHPFICHLHSSFQDERFLFFVMDYCSGGELFFHLSRLKFFSESIARFYVAEVVLAIDYLHSKNIVYRDLKPENILLDADGHVQLVDFGLAKENITEYCHGTKSLCGTYEYLAPEVVKRSGHGKAVDWWTLGMVFFEMLTGFPPWYTKDQTTLLDSICNASIRTPTYLSPRARSLVHHLLEKDPKKRLGSVRGGEELKDHPFFLSVDWSQLLQRKTKAPLTTLTTNDASNFDKQFTSQRVDENIFRLKQENLTPAGDSEDQRTWSNWSSCCESAHTSR